ncbi:hypothetical protein PGT21_033215 [Puccinia graminis f. sp. tritici]|uniref:Uncharacterized protein n=1 Tax=Puccinia graminis f. sp. tritici TaxID=56615 RepID=A0A5B0QZ07_PUCGR|nr:hypothetical protein PGT21_033215 [Puccinia graminis f. sp. tritici]
MCPPTTQTNGEQPTTTNGHPIEETHVPIDSQPAQEKTKQHNPYGPRLSDFLSNTSNFSIIESTLREGEQFANAFFGELYEFMPLSHKKEN